MKELVFLGKISICLIILSNSPHLLSNEFSRGGIRKIGSKDKWLSKAKGSWLKKLEFDNQVYWDLELVEPAKFIHKPVEFMLSDSIFREDRNWMAK